jgi:hypothetical protein
MGRIELLQPFLEGGIRNTNFFNGRLLSAEDLRREQQANRDRDAQLAGAVGTGVVSGLEVESAPQSGGSGLTNAVVRVRAGLALNENGQSLALPLDTEVALVRELETVNAEAGLFAMCAPPQQTAVVSGAGVYLLVITPASGYEQRAPVSGLGNAGLTSPGCGSNYAVEGVQFRLVDVDVNTNAAVSANVRAELNALMSAGGAANLSLLRNMLAQLSSGEPRRRSFVADPFVEDTERAGTKLTTSLKLQGTLTRCDVPLALIYWTASGIGFTDMWSVRRRPSGRPDADAWSPALDDGRVANAEAMFRQFQEQLEAIRRDDPHPQGVAAKAYFRYLPPAGMLPLKSGGSPGGFDYLKFFEDITYRPPVYLEGARAIELLRSALAYAPHDLAGEELLRVYRVRENMQAQAGAEPPQPYMIFTSGHVPYHGDAYYNLAHWNFSNYS